MRASSSGPMSLTVARTGWPCAALASANTSQSVAGQAAGAGGSMPRSFSSAASLGLTLPGWVMPVRSPFTSAMKTGTPLAAEVLGQRLQRHRLAGAGGAGDQAVPVRHRRQQEALDVAVLGEEDRVGHGSRPKQEGGQFRACSAAERSRARPRVRERAARRDLKSRVFATSQPPRARSEHMAGHSKWANIQHRKGRQDEKRGKVWTRLIREIIVAARHGGGDLAMNPRLRLAVEKAKAREHAGRHDQEEHRQGDRQPRRHALRGDPLRGLRHRRRGDHRRLHDRQPRPHRGRGAPRVQQVRRQPGHRRLGRVPVQALRPVRVRAGHRARTRSWKSRSKPAPTT